MAVVGFLQNYIMFLACLATLSQIEVIKAHTFLSKTDQHKTGNVLLHCCMCFSLKM